MVRSLDAMISLTAEQKVSKELGDKIYLGQMVGKEVSPGHFFTRSQGCLASLQIGKKHRLKIFQIIFSILKKCVCTGEECLYSQHLQSRGRKISVS